MKTNAADIELFNRIRNDDRRSFDKLFQLYYNSLCHFAFGYLKNMEDPEEIVGDVFFELWTKRTTLDIRFNVRSYLYTCVKNKCLALLSAKRLPILSLNQAHSDAPDNVYSPQEALEFIELNRQYENAVDSLPLHCRQIFLMSRFEGLKYREIADILSIAEKTVENQLIKALHILRGALLHEKNVSASLSVNRDVTKS